MSKKVAIIFEKVMGVGELDELLSIYNYQADYFIPAGEHEFLLATHIVDMRMKLNRMHNNIDKTCRWSMNLSEAAAFYQFWNITDTSAFPLATVLINDIIKKINKEGHFPQYKIRKAYQLTK